MTESIPTLEAFVADAEAWLDDHTARSYRNAYLKYDFREQMWLANYRRLLRSDPDLFETLREA